MRYLAYHENLSRGSFGFPLELYSIDKSHPRYEMPYHWHLECELLLVLEGEFSLSIDGKQINLSKGQSAFIPSGAIHGGIPADCIYKCIVFDMDKLLEGNPLKQENYFYITKDFSRINNFFDAHTNSAELIQKIFDSISHKKSGYEFILIGLFFQFIGCIIEEKLYIQEPNGKSPNHKHSEQIKGVLRFIRSNYSESLSLEDLARKSALNSHYFCKIFHQITGKTPIEYLNYYRIECSAKMLCKDDKSVTEIALSCGFNDLSYFIRIFKKYKNQSPSSFRKAYLKAN